MMTQHWNREERAVEAELGSREIQRRILELPGQKEDYFPPGAALTVVRAEMTQRMRAAAQAALNAVNDAALIVPDETDHVTDDLIRRSAKRDGEDNPPEMSTYDYDPETGEHRGIRARDEAALESAARESGNGGESVPAEAMAVRRAVDVAQRVVLVMQLGEAGHGGCADDLNAAFTENAARVAYEIAEHVELACGDPQAEMPGLAARLREWADAHDDLDPRK